MDASRQRQRKPTIGPGERKDTLELKVKSWTIADSRLSVAIPSKGRAAFDGATLCPNCFAELTRYSAWKGAALRNEPD
jgi:hypothetical protein